MGSRCRVCREARCAYRPSKRLGTRRKNDASSAREARQKGARLGWEHRKEADEAVEVNLDPHELALWDRTKGQFRGTPEQRERAFRQYVHDHPNEIYTQVEVVSDARLAKMIREHAKLVGVEVPCEPPYRVRTKELCGMKKNPKRGKRGRKKNASLFESKADRARRLSDERARKRLEAPSRRTRKGDKTRGDKVKYARKKNARTPVCDVPRPNPRRARARKKNEHLSMRSLARESEANRALFKKLHWDVEAKGVRRYFASSLRAPFAVLGELHKIEYVTRKGNDRVDVTYHHTFQAGRTYLCVNADKELVICKTTKTGGYTVEGPGIIG